MADPHPLYRCEVRDWYEPIDPGTSALIQHKPPGLAGKHHHHHGLNPRHTVPVKGPAAPGNLAASVQPVRGPIGQQARVFNLPPPAPSGVQMQVGDNDVIKAFARKAGSWGVPTSFLFPVADSYQLNVLSNDDADLDNVSDLEVSGRPLHRRFNLHRFVLDAMKNAELGKNLDWNPIGTVFHEATHAYMKLHQLEEPLKSIQAEGTQYYQRSAAKGGEVIDDGLHAFRETAAEYAEHRVSGCLSSMDLIYRDLRLGKLTAEALNKIRIFYNRTMKESVAGGSYEDKGIFKSVTKTATKPIPPSSKQYVDKEILEGKIPDSFDDSKLFRDILTKAGRGSLLKGLP
jgi:hypothetical protein